MPLNWQVHYQILQMRRRRLRASKNARDNIPREHHQIHNAPNIGSGMSFLLCQIADGDLPIIQLPIPAVGPHQSIHEHRIVVRFLESSDRLALRIQCHLATTIQFKSCCFRCVICSIQAFFCEISSAKLFL